MGTCAAAPSFGPVVHVSGVLPLRAPLFPIPGAILFPRAQLPLHIFEPRYRDMVRDAVDGDGLIAMVQPQLVEVEDDRKQPLYPVGCVGEIVGLEELEDGRFNIVLNGSNRFRIINEVDLDTPYRNADLDVGAFDDREPEPLGMTERAEVEREARRLGDALGLAVDWSAVSRLDDEMLVNAIAQVAPFDVSAKQALLEAESLGARADLLVQLMQFLRLSQGGNDLQPTLQ
jgi:Lon protease-like protein